MAKKATKKTEDKGETVDVDNATTDNAPAAAAEEEITILETDVDEAFESAATGKTPATVTRKTTEAAELAEKVAKAKARARAKGFDNGDGDGDDEPDESDESDEPAPLPLPADASADDTAEARLAEPLARILELRDAGNNKELRLRAEKYSQQSAKAYTAPRKVGGETEDEYQARAAKSLETYLQRTNDLKILANAANHAVRVNKNMVRSTS